MKKLGKKVVALLVAFCLIVSFVSVPSIRSNAADGLSVNTGNKIFTLYILPCAGLKVNEAIDTGTFYQSYNLNFKTIIVDATFKDPITKEEYPNGTILKKDTTYLYEVVLSTNNNKPMDFSGYSVELVNQLNPEDDSFISNPECSLIEGDDVNTFDQMTFSCLVTISDDLPSFDLGTAYVDLSKEPYEVRQHEASFSFEPFFTSLDRLDDEVVKYDFDNKGYDLDLDGYNDLSIGWDNKEYIYKSADSRTTENVTLSLSAEDKDKINRKGKEYYSKITVIFAHCDIAKATIDEIPEAVYTGKEIKPDPVVKYGDKVLVKDADYEVSYKNNISTGTATVVVTGINEYKGEITKDFTIKPAPVQTGSEKSNSSTGSSNSSTDESGVPVLNGTVNGTLETGLSVTLPDGTKVKNQWGIVNGKKYYFDARGYAAANEYANGMWFGADGTLDENYSMEWKSNATGWWIEDKSGWYPVSKWLKIDGSWYYFLDSGYMDYSEYRDGCWLGSDGAWVEEYYGGHWCSDSTGWWYEDASGWYPQSQYLWIDGVHYYFGADGYMQ